MVVWCTQNVRQDGNSFAYPYCIIDRVGQDLVRLRQDDNSLIQIIYFIHNSYFPDTVLGIKPARVEKSH